MKKIIFALLVTSSLLGCYESKLSNTENPDDSTLELTTSWGVMHEGEIEPSKYTMYIDGERQSLSDSINRFILEEYEEHDFLVHNNPRGMNITDGIASLTAATRAVLDPEPNPLSLYYGREITILERDLVTYLTLNTKRGTAPILFNLRYEPSEVVNVSSVKVELKGIAAIRNLHTDELSDEVTLTHYPIITSSSSSISVLYNILGVVGDKQELIVTITDINGGSRVISSDITKALRDFNEEMEPLTFTHDIELPLDATLDDIVINKWDIGYGINGEIFEPTI